MIMLPNPTKDNKSNSKGQRNLKTHIWTKTPYRKMSQSELVIFELEEEKRENKDIGTSHYPLPSQLSTFN